MLPANFNIVLTGENLPVQNVSVGEFVFNHRTLRESVRFPMGLIAEDRGVNLQILPDRIQATVTEVRDLTRDAANLLKMLEPIFDYVGQKAFSAVGHNAQFVLDRSIPKSRVAETTLNGNAISDLIGGHTEAADVSVFRHIPNGAMLRTSLLTQTPIEQVAIEFNAHFDVIGSSVREPLSSLQNSLDVMVDIAARVEASLQPQKVAG